MSTSLDEKKKHNTGCRHPLQKKKIKRKYWMS